MPDMLAKLYWKPRDPVSAYDMWNLGVEIVRPDMGQKRFVLDWIGANFHPGWAQQADAAFANRPLTIFIAIHDEKEIVGFACYDATRKNFFGPMGVVESWRKQNIGEALVLRSFEAMRESGYEYAIIHAVGPVAFYSNVCGAEPIPDSEAGSYRREIRQ